MLSIISCKDLKSNDSLRELAKETSSLHITDRIEDLTPESFRGLEHIQQLLIGPNHKELSNPAKKSVSIPPFLFAELPFLRELQIRGKGVTEIEGHAFTGLTHLNALVLSGNRIEEIQPDAFSGLKNLGALIMDHNKLRNIRSGYFDHLPNLNRLNLESNLIEEIGFNSFKKNELISLKLGGNKIIDLDPRALNGLRNLSELDLRGNPLTECDWSFILNLGLHTRVSFQLKSRNLSLTKLDVIQQPWGSLRKNTAGRHLSFVGR